MLRCSAQWAVASRTCLVCVLGMTWVVRILQVIQCCALRVCCVAYAASPHLLLPPPLNRSWEPFWPLAMSCPLVVGTGQPSLALQHPSPPSSLGTTALLYTRSVPPPAALGAEVGSPLRVGLPRMCPRAAPVEAAWQIWLLTRMRTFPVALCVLGCHLPASCAGVACTATSEAAGSPASPRSTWHPYVLPQVDPCLTTLLLCSPAV